MLDWTISHAVEILTLPVVEALGMVKWLLYQIQKGIFEIYDNLRFSLVLGGFLYPEPRDLDRLPCGKSLINAGSVHLVGGISPTFSNYPRKSPLRPPLAPIEYHLAYPNRLRERPFAEPMPRPFFGANAETFISDSVGWDPAIEAFYDCDDIYGSGQQFTHDIESATWDTTQFGSALPFSASLIVHGMAKLPNFNLDGDRGYAWKTWRADDPANIDTDNPVPSAYVDP